MAGAEFRAADSSPTEAFVSASNENTGASTLSSNVCLPTQTSSRFSLRYNLLFQSDFSSPEGAKQKTGQSLLSSSLCNYSQTYFPADSEHVFNPESRSMQGAGVGRLQVSKYKR